MTWADGERPCGGARLAVLGAVLAAWSVGTPAEASRNRELTVMTQNLYLGSSLQPAIEADTAGEFVAAVATIYGTAVFTNFPARAQVIADEIAAQKPDLIGLQEVSTWTATPLHVGPTPPSFDFLVILQEALAARGLSYEVAAVSENASIGPAPLVAPDFGCNPPSPTTGAFDCVVSLSDRDVILVNTTTPALHWSGAQSGRYEEQATLDIPGPGEESFDRGWASIEVSYRGRDFKFVNTHLEVEDFEAVQEAQAARAARRAAGRNRERGPRRRLQLGGQRFDDGHVRHPDQQRARRCGAGARRGHVLPERHADEPGVAAQHSDRPHPHAGSGERQRPGLPPRRDGAAAPTAGTALGVRPRRRGGGHPAARLTAPQLASWHLGGDRAGKLASPVGASAT